MLYMNFNKYKHEHINPYRKVGTYEIYEKWEASTEKRENIIFKPNVHNEYVKSAVLILLMIYDEFYTSSLENNLRP